MCRYIRFILENLQPIRIADNEKSQGGQTDTLRYIPGSTVRGIVINTLIKQDEFFAKYKQVLFSEKIQFLNANPLIGGKAMFAPLKGFYEDKKETTGRKKLENVLMGEISHGVKRSYLGSCCRVEDDTILYSNVQLGEELNINIGREGKKNIFRNQYLKANQKFEGYIVLHEAVGKTVAEYILKVFEQGIIYIGNKKGSGYGACRCIDLKLCEGVPYGEIRTQKDTKDFYLIMLSNTTMLNQYGQNAGIYLPELERSLGCRKLELERCASSVVEVHGFNRVWKGESPSTVMYAAGSVFHIKASEIISEEKFRALETIGIGIRRNEGFGQIAIFGGYERIQYKMPISLENKPRNQEYFSKDRIDISQEIEIAAKGLADLRIRRQMEKYIVNQPLKLGGTSRSNLGTIEALCLELRYSPKEAKEKIMEYIDHIKEKDNKQKFHNQQEKRDDLVRYVTYILKNNLYDILDIHWKDNKIMKIEAEKIMSETEIMRYKLELIIQQIRYANREMKNNAR